jgi:hypothetical protein
MHHRLLTGSVHLTLLPLSLALLALSGCGSGSDRNDATIKANSTVPADVKTDKVNLDKEVDKLNEIGTLSNTDDISKTCTELKTKSNVLDDSLTRTQNDTNSAIAAGQDQLVQWRKQSDGFTDPDLRTASDKRQETLQQAIDALSSSNANLKAKSDAYTSEESQTLAALDVDPSRPGVDAIKPEIRKLVDNAPGLKDALSEVADRSNSVMHVINP